MGTRDISSSPNFHTCHNNRRYGSLTRKNLSALTGRPQKHLRRRHPRLPQLPLLQAIPHLNRHPPGTWLLGLLNLRRNLLLGLQARLRQHKILHRGRSRHLHTTKRRPHILDWGVEKGTIYIGTNSAGDKIQIASKTEKHVPIYNLTVTVWKKGEKDGKVVSIKKPFTQWFDKKGGFVVLPFQQMIASAEDADKSMDDKWASLLAESSGVSLGAEETATP